MFLQDLIIRIEFEFTNFNWKNNYLFLKKLLFAFG